MGAFIAEQIRIVTGRGELSQLVICGNAGAVGQRVINQRLLLLRYVVKEMVIAQGVCPFFSEIAHISQCGDGRIVAWIQGAVPIP
jgi:hypothetical protein